MIQLIKPNEASKPKKRKWCCNELVILLYALWMCGVIFILATYCRNEGEGPHHYQMTASEKMMQNISLAVIGVVLLFFVALLTTTRLIYPDGNVAAYLVQDKKCIIGVLNFLIMLIILSNIFSINFFSQDFGNVHHRLALMYVFMSCIPKLFARLELNFPLCSLMIVFEVSMTLTVSFIHDDDEQLAMTFYFW